MSLDGGYDAFLSYAHADADRVRVLHARLEREGLRVFLDENEVLAGDVIVSKLEQGILRSRTGIVVFSPASVTSAWVENEYAALMTRAINGQARFIPVLYGDVEIPPFAAARRWVDFRKAVGPVYDAKVSELADALRGRAPSRETGLYSPEDPTRPEGPLDAVLRVAREQVTFQGSTEAEHAPSGARYRLEDLLMRLRNGRSDTQLKATAVAGGRHALLTSIGEELGSTFLAGRAGDAVTAEIARAERLNVPLRLAVEVEDELAHLPWETLVLPGRHEPLALHPRVEMYRRVPDGGTTPALQIPGPLRILVVVASPDVGGGPLLDYEAELALILDIVDPARRQGDAYVRVLNEGTVAAIREALEEERFHVLHISCHAAPGTLALEDEDGRRDDVTTERFLRDVLPAGRGVPLIVLSGCSTALPARMVRSGQDEEGEAALGGLAHGLCEAGVPAVLAMTAPVTDFYATRLAGTLYRALALHESPEALRAFCQARRDLELQRRGLPADDPESSLVEWATPALFLRGPSLPFHAPGHVEEVSQPSEPYLPDVPLRPVGGFVGRRAELRTLSRALRENRPGVLIHGIGGVGKSSLAAELLRRSGTETGLLVSQVSQTGPDQILDALGRALHAASDDPAIRRLAVDLRDALGRALHAASDDPAIRRLAVDLRSAHEPWADRLQLLGPLLTRLPITLLLDNFEDNLDHDGSFWRVRDEELAAFLSAWIRTPGRSRLLITSRHPFPLPRGAEGRLTAHHLGPLSWPETRKLIWRLPGLDALTVVQQERAYAAVGGHPRTLEYLDALLRGGHARFDDVTERLEAHLHDRGITDPRAWLRRAGSDFDRALAEAVTLAVDDVLLGDLVDGLDELALRVLVGASVFRVPVEAAGVAWSVSQVVEREPDAEAEERLGRVRALLVEARRVDPRAGVGDVGLSREEVELVLADGRARLAAPLAPPEGWEQAVEVLARAGLLTPLPAPGPDLGGVDGVGGRWVVHRWTASSVADGLGGRVAEGLLAAAHGAAADFWSWRVRVWPQGREADVDDLLEARFHLHAAGRLDEALSVTDVVCERLHMWGAWGREEQLYRETLTWLPDSSGRLAAVSYHQLGNIAQDRGEYGRAWEYYQQSLTISEELGDRAGVGSSYHQLGNIAQARNEYGRAWEYYQQSLTIFEELGDRAGVGSSYHQLGVVAQLRGEYGRALEYYQQALAIKEELGDRAGVSGSYHQLGMVAQMRGEYGRALEYYQQSLTISEELGDRAGVGISYHQLGVVAQERGEYDRALGYYQQSLTIFEDVGDRAGAASSLSQIGVLYTETGRAAEAVPRNLQALAIRQQLQIPQAAIDLHWLRQQRTDLGNRVFHDLLTEHLDPQSITNLLNVLDEQEAGS